MATTVLTQKNRHLKTNICHISSVGNPLDGRVFFKQCCSLKSMGYSVTYISKFSTSGIVEKSGIEWIPLSSSKFRIVRMFWVSFVQVLYYSLKTKACIYHFHEPEIIPAMIILKLLNKRVVYEIHENYEGSISTKPYIPNKILRILIAKVYTRIENLCIKMFDGFILARPDLTEKIPSDQHKQIICNFPIYKNVPKKKYYSKIKTDVIYVGQITKIRGILELIQAFDFLDNIQLQLLGWFENQLFKDKCYSLPSWEKVRYLGICNANQVTNYINNADIGIVNFLPHPNHMTTLATKPFEYMMCGLPMILPDFPYWKRFFSNSAIYADPCNPESIANSIKKLSFNKNLMKKMGYENSKKIKDKYRWDIEFKKIPKFYEDILCSN